MRLSLGFGLLMLAACSDPAGPPGGSGGDLSQQQAQDLRAADGPRGTSDLYSDYPPGPYGSEVGQTLPFLAWEGYANPTASGVANTRPYGAYTMNDLRKSGSKYALIYAADFF